MEWKEKRVKVFSEAYLILPVHHRYLMDPEHWRRLAKYLKEYLGLVFHARGFDVEVKRVAVYPVDSTENFGRYAVEVEIQYPQKMDEEVGWAIVRFGRFLEVLSDLEVADFIRSEMAKKVDEGGSEK